MARCRECESRNEKCDCCGRPIPKPVNCPCCGTQLKEPPRCIVSGFITNLKLGKLNHRCDYNGIIATFTSDRLAEPVDVRVTPENLLTIENSLELGSAIVATLVPLEFSDGHDRFCPSYGSRSDAASVRVRMVTPKITKYRDFKLE